MSTRGGAHELLPRLLGPSGQEVTCDECFELLDTYVESELAGTDFVRLENHRETT